MKIESSVKIELLPHEVEVLIKDYLQSEGFRIDNVRFDVNGHNVEGDWNSSMPMEYDLTRIICTGQEIKKE